MQVIVRGRNEGKTTELIEWLLEGKQQEGYPGWSRAIVCTTPTMIMVCDRMIKERAHAGSIRFDQMLKGANTSQAELDRIVNDIRKSVWGLRDYRFNASGMRQFEFAIDDAEMLLSEILVGRQPSVITMTGELYVHPSS